MNLKGLLHTRFCLVLCPPQGTGENIHGAALDGVEFIWCTHGTEVLVQFPPKANVVCTHQNELIDCHYSELIFFHQIQKVLTIAVILCDVLR